MHIGITQFSTGYTIRIDDLAREAEDRGFESLFVPEHTHIPTQPPQPLAGRAASCRRSTSTPSTPSSGWPVPRRRRRACASAPPSPCSPSATPSCSPRSARPSTCSPAGASSWHRGGGGTRRRWRTTAPRSRTASRSCATVRRRSRRYGARRSPSTTARSSTSIRSGRARSRCQKPNPRAARGRDPVLARTGGGLLRGMDAPHPRVQGREGGDGPARGIRGQGRTRRRHHSDQRVRRHRRSGALDAYREAGVFRALITIPPKGRDEVLPLLDKHAKLL